MEAVGHAPQMLDILVVGQDYVMGRIIPDTPESLASLRNMGSGRLLQGTYATQRIWLLDAAAAGALALLQ